MTRIVKHTATGPLEVKPSDQSTWICMCGLSKNYPFCDGGHKLARQQETDGKVYVYENDTAREIEDPGNCPSV
ncbi:CDGSH iron-sulfur domain-containing protein [Planctomycetales bacterium ZRK34]|nr:CDGSH iron-sulfur domain-containing protein [Planctomycetales bacterium ZRK34]